MRRTPSLTSSLLKRSPPCVRRSLRPSPDLPIVQVPVHRHRRSSPSAPRRDPTSKSEWYRLRRRSSAIPHDRESRPPTRATAPERHGKQLLSLIFSLIGF